jgi:hypothetical protein
MTPILPFIQERLKSTRKEIDADLLLWLSGKKHPNLEFSGSLVLNYWGHYLDSHIQKIINTAFETNIDIAVEHDLDPSISCKDAAFAANEAIKGLLDLMAKYDQRMRGKGYPQNVPLRDVAKDYARCSELANNRANNEIKLLNMPKKNTLKLPLTAENGFWWFIKYCHWSVYLWLIPVLLSLLIGAFSLGLGAGRNDTFTKIYDILHNATSTQPSTTPPIPQNKNNTAK